MLPEFAAPSGSVGFHHLRRFAQVDVRIEEPVVERDGIRLVQLRESDVALIEQKRADAIVG